MRADAGTLVEGTLVQGLRDGHDEGGRLYAAARAERVAPLFGDQRTVAKR
ncbi:hypothetical protein SNE510_75650 [Streptomyces sp. NE5-10]|nr:hypothetical protein SNE510_75650 [Streptomyces sp. NE5-10]